MTSVPTAPSVDRVSSTGKILEKSHSDEQATAFVFFLFCMWTFILLCRPQDLFPSIAPIRPVLTMGILTLIGVFIRYSVLPGPSLFKERQLKYYTALIIVMILGIPFSFYPRNSFMDIFTGYINVVFFVFIFYKIVGSVNRLLTIILIGCLGNGLYSFFALSEFVPGTGRISFGGVFDPNDLAYVTLAFLPLNLIFISRDNALWVRFACLSCFGMGLLLILFSGSRGGMVALGVAAVFFLFSRTHTIKAPLKIAAVVLSLFIASVTVVDTERYMTLFSIEDDYNITDETGRIELWKIGGRAMLDNPLSGVGVSSYPIAVGRDREARGAETIKWQAAHNSVVQIGAETGIIGLLLFLLLSLNVWRILSKAKQTTSQEKLVKIAEMGKVGFVGMFVAGLFLSQAYSFYMAFYIAISAIVSQLLSQELPAREMVSPNKNGRA